MHHSHSSPDEARQKLRELIKDIQFGMLTTVDHDGLLRSRPMAVQQAEGDDALWFFTHDATTKVDEIAREHRVGVSFAEPKKQQYVSVSGIATAMRDAAKARELWSPLLKMWFPRGPDDPDILLLHVHIDAAEYWDSSSRKMVFLWSALKGALSGSQPDPEALGEHEKIRRS